MPELVVSRRLRRTPFAEAVEAHGPRSYTVYNHMLLPMGYRDPVEDYHHLKEAVQLWDVACERQVELRGRDAAKLMQWLTPRDLSKLTIGGCAYVPICDERGGMLNDPVALKLAEDRFWISIADSDLLFWVNGLARGAGLEVEVFEPDVSPLAVQGPKAEALMVRLFGEAIRELKFYRFARFGWQGRDWLISRSGFSKQGGFEIYVEGAEQGMPLWSALWEAGQDLDIRPGSPTTIERIEGGLLSYGSDMTREDTPFHAGLGRFCHLDRVPGCIGHAALSKVVADGPDRQIRAIEVAGEVPVIAEAWPLLAGDRRVGQVTSIAKSPMVGTNVAIGMVAESHWGGGTELVCLTPDGPRDALVREKFWN